MNDVVADSILLEVDIPPNPHLRYTQLISPGLSVHMNQVHKETLTIVDNSLPNRQGLEVEIFGMEGIPEDVVQAHNQRMFAPRTGSAYHLVDNP